MLCLHALLYGMSYPGGIFFLCVNVFGIICNNKNLPCYHPYKILHSVVLEFIQAFELFWLLSYASVDTNSE